MRIPFFSSKPKYKDTQALINVCPFEVDNPIMVHEWNDLTFIHYEFEPYEIQRLLPDGLKVELIDDKAWVSLVPFKMHIEFPIIGKIPHLGNFPETNVRTYVTGPDGTRGIWFFSLDASRLSAVIAARVAYRLPYFWAKMHVTKFENSIAYESKRIDFFSRRKMSKTLVTIGEKYEDDELQNIHHLLSAQWKLFSYQFGAVYEAHAEHEPWQLFKAELQSIDDELITACGLPKPAYAPIVQYSPGVRVNISMPRKSIN